MASRAHRWKGDDTPLTGVHGGSAEAARRAIRESKALLYERARAVVRDVIQRNHDAARYADWEARGKPPSPTVPRRDRLRPSAADRTLRNRLYEAQRGLCGLCDTPLGCSMPTFDHVTPRALGGRNAGNLLLAHSGCNSRKADRRPTTRELQRLAEVNARLAQGTRQGHDREDGRGELSE